MPSIVTFTSDTLPIRPWADEVIDQLGFDPRSTYVERFWLGVLGPSTTWLLRRLAAGFDVQPAGFDLPLAETARSLGLGDRGGRHSPFLRSVNRAIQFGMATAAGGSELFVRRRIPPLARRQIDRLAPEAQADHQRWQEAQLREPPAATQRRRGRQMALSLVELGEDVEEIERQLLQWHYHPVLARDAAAWAWARRCAPGTADVS
jgi:hypothetical protein